MTMKKFEKTRILERNKAYSKIIKWFFSYPLLPISLSDLARETKTSKATAASVVNTLLKEDFLMKEEIGRIWRISCNQKHRYNFTKKISYNLALVYEALYDYGIINEIYKIAGNPKTIILFGSYRKGDDTDKSDLDIAVEVIGNEDVKIIHIGNIVKLGYRKNVPVNLHIFSRRKIDLNLFSNIANGIVLEGFLETHP